MYKFIFSCAFLLLTGCQHISPTMMGSYHGKELLPDFFKQHHSRHENTGLEFRGFDKVTRHYF